MQTTTDSDWVSVAQAAALLGVARATVYRRYRAGDWPYSEIVVQFGPTLKVSRRKLLDLERGDPT